ncbi:hypothetical protein BC828DRAFT_415610 [Blastocladiella britannica]|nr:hypothetical protein BC828DRAFT_415610 [Blastocladiella britannica]
MYPDLASPPPRRPLPPGLDSAISLSPASVVGTPALTTASILAPIPALTRLARGPPPPPPPPPPPAQSPSLKIRSSWIAMLESVLTGDILRRETQRLFSMSSWTEPDFKFELWLAVRGVCRGHSIAEERALVDSMRLNVPDALARVLAFRADPTASRLALRTAVADQLAAVAAMRDLYPTDRALRADQPLYDAPVTQAKIDVLQAWGNLHDELDLVMRVFSVWTGDIRALVASASPTSTAAIETASVAAAATVVSRSPDPSAPMTIGERIADGPIDPSSLSSSSRPAPSSPTTTTAAPARSSPTPTTAGDDERANSPETRRPITTLEALLRERDPHSPLERRFVHELPQYLRRLKATVLLYSDQFVALGLAVDFESISVLGQLSLRIASEINRIRLSYASSSQFTTTAALDQTFHDTKLTLVIGHRIWQEFVEFIQPHPGWSVEHTCAPTLVHDLAKLIELYFQLLEMLLTSEENRSKELEMLDLEWTFCCNLMRTAHLVYGLDVTIVVSFCKLLQHRFEMLREQFAEAVRGTASLERVLDALKLRSRHAKNFFRLIGHHILRARTIPVMDPALSAAADSDDGYGGGDGDDADAAMEAALARFTHGLFQAGYTVQARLHGHVYAFTRSAQLDMTRFLCALPCDPAVQAANHAVVLVHWPNAPAVLHSVPVVESSVDETPNGVKKVSSPVSFDAATVFPPPLSPSELPGRAVLVASSAETLPSVYADAMAELAAVLGSHFDACAVAAAEAAHLHGIASPREREGASSATMYGGSHDSGLGAQSFLPLGSPVSRSGVSVALCVQHAYDQLQTTISRYAFSLLNGTDLIHCQQQQRNLSLLAPVKWCDDAALEMLYAYASDFSLRFSRLVMSPRRLLHRLLLFTTDWIRFTNRTYVQHQQGKPNRKTFRWALLALEFTLSVCRRGGIVPDAEFLTQDAALDLAAADQSKRDDLHRKPLLYSTPIATSGSHHACTASATSSPARGDQRPGLGGLLASTTSGEVAAAQPDASVVSLLSAAEFQALRVAVGQCMSLLISHFESFSPQLSYPEMAPGLSPMNAEQFLGNARAKIDVIEQQRADWMQSARLVGHVLERAAGERSLASLSSSASSVSMRWQHGKYLGGGTYGSVFMGVNLTTGELLAVKEIRIADNANFESLKAMVTAEMRVMEKLSHPNVVEYYGIEVHRDKVYLFMEYCPNGTLSSLLDEGGLEENVVQRIAFQIVQGLAYLHSAKIVHRDIKPDNILLDQAGNVKLVDFGAAKLLTNKLTIASQEPGAMSLIGTPNYLAPEVIVGASGGRVGSQDIYSLGCVVYELLTGKAPWAHLDNQWAIIYHAAVGPPVIPDTIGASPAALSFIRACLQTKAADRPLATELLSHPFLAPLTSQAAAAAAAAACPGPLGSRPGNSSVSSSSPSSSGAANRPSLHRYFTSLQPQPAAASPGRASGSGPRANNNESMGAPPPTKSLSASSERWW